MKAIKIFSMLLLGIILAVHSSAVAEEKKPVRLVRLPIIIQHNELDYETAAGLEMKIARAANVPLIKRNQQVAEYINTKESIATIQEVWRNLRAQNRYAKVADAVKIMAQELNADLVICPILRRYNQVEIINLDENLLRSSVAAEMIIYDKRTDELIDEKVARAYDNEYNRFGTAAYLASECFDVLIHDTGLIHIVRAIGR